MTDTVSSEKRSSIMRQVKSKNTRLELLIRSALHKSGYRFRIHQKHLPGNPDIVLRKYNSVVQVRGCFWHGHDCKRARIPKSNDAYWKDKIWKNKVRDQANDQKLVSEGWTVIVLWECSISTNEKRIECLDRLRRAISKYSSPTIVTL